MKKLLSKKYISLLLVLAIILTNMTAFASGGFVNGDFSGQITIPKTESAYVNGTVQKNIFAGFESSKAKPWVYADVKLTSVRSQNDKLNYGVLALNRAIAYFQDNDQHFKNNDFSIILSNGFVIDKNNYNKQIVYDEAKKALLDNESYREDTVFTIAFLSGENKVVKQSMWKLIDIINLAPGSTFTSNTTFNVGISTEKQVTLAETLGIKLTDKVGVNLGIDKFANIGALAEINSETNQSLSRTFNQSNRIEAQKTENVTVKHEAINKGMLVLRYQLNDNINVDLDIFNNITKSLQDNMNMGGKNIVKIEPASGLKGTDIPTNVVFDVMVSQ